MRLTWLFLVVEEGFGNSLREFCPALRYRGARASTAQWVVELSQGSNHW